MKKILLFLSFLLMSIGIYGTTISLTLSDFPNLSSSYSSGSITKGGVTFNYTDFIKNNTNIQVKASSGLLYNSTAFPGKITRIKITHYGEGRPTTVCYGTSKNPSENATNFYGSKTISVSGNNTYFKITRGSNAAYWSSVEITYEDSPTPTTYTVTYSDGGSEAIEDTTEYTSGASVTTRKNTFTKDGYIFDCWQLGSRNIDEDSTFVITQDTTLIAKWLTNASKNETTGDCVFYEKFNKCDGIGGNDGNWKDEQGSSVVAHEEITGWPYDFDNNGWYGEKTFIGNKCIKVGSTKYGGYIETPLISSEKNNKLLLSFKAGAWDGSSEKTEIYLSSEDAVFDKDTIEIEKGLWNVYHVSMTEISNTFKIKWYVNSGNNRFFLDSICVSPYVQEAPIDIVTWHNDSIFLSKDYFNEIDFKADSIRIKPLQSKKKIYEMPDSTLKVNVDLSWSYCDTLHFIVCNSTEAIEQHIKIPYIIESNEVNIDTIDNDDKCDIVIHNKLNVNTNKEKRDVIVYPQGILNIYENDTFTVNSLTLRRDNDSVPYLSYKGTLDIKNGMFFEIRSDGSDWRWVVLPDTFNIGEINSNVYENGAWSDALVKHYDGDVRANNGSGGWKLTPVNTVFNPGYGFIFGAYMDSETEKRIYRISLDTAILKLESKDKGVQVYSYGKGLNKPANDLGWNVVGNPFMENCNISSSNPIRIGELIKTDTNPWDGKWVVDSMSPEKKVNYIVVKDYHDEYADAGYYKSIPLKVDGHSLEPFTSFFIQVDTALTNPTLLFTKGSGISKAPSRISEDNEEIFLRVNVGNKKTGCFVSNKYDDDYEIGYDLESNENIYQSINGYKLLYSAINDSILSSGIKVYTAGGILSLDEKTDTHRFSEIKALYNDELYDLLNGETAEVNSEFILFGTRRKNEVATGLEENYKNLTTHKVIVNGILYIIVNDKAYNVLGERVR